MAGLIKDLWARFTQPDGPVADDFSRRESGEVQYATYEPPTKPIALNTGKAYQEHFVGEQRTDGLFPWMVRIYDGEGGVIEKPGASSSHAEAVATAVQWAHAKLDSMVQP